jgi:predicted Zn-dependent peptidase
MLDRTISPSFKKSNHFSLINPQRTVLSNGLSVTFVNGGEQEVIKIEFIFKAARWHENKSGVSYFTSHLLQKGTTQKTSYQISSEFDQLGIHLEINPGYDVSSIAIYGLTKNINKLFELTNDIITNPIFPEIELQQAKDIYIQGLKINLEKTSYLASLQLRQNIFSEVHPYGKEAKVEDVNNIERSNLVSFHKDFFGDVQVICSGKITAALKESIEKSLRDLKIQKVTEPKIGVSNVALSKQHLDKDNTVQSSIRLGKKIVTRTHPDYPAVLLLNHIFGGFFGSRLMKNIREEKGLTYGIYSSVATLMHDGYLSIGADVNKENRELTVEEIKKEMRALRTKQIGSDELETARNHFIGSFQSEISTPFANADKIKTIILNELPADYYQVLLQTMDTLTSDDLQATAQKYFDEESFFEVTVG